MKLDEYQRRRDLPLGLYRARTAARVVVITDAGRNWLELSDLLPSERFAVVGIDISRRWCVGAAFDFNWLRSFRKCQKIVVSVQCDNKRCKPDNHTKNCKVTTLASQVHYWLEVNCRPNVDVFTFALGTTAKESANVLIEHGDTHNES